MIYTTTTYQGSALWLIDWAGQGSGSFEIWLDGDVIEVVPEGVYQYTYSGLNTLSTNDDYESTAPPIEVWDTTESGTPTSQAQPAYVFLQWHRVADASYYKIERYTGGAWGEVAQMPETGSQGYYQYHSSTLVDKTAGQYRVSAYDSAGNTRIPIEADFVIRCLPATPSVTVSWNSGTGEVEVS